MRKLLAKIQFALEHWLFGRRRLRPVRNATGRTSPAPRGRALLVYIALPFHLRAGHALFNFHQSLQQAKWIAEVLHEFGFEVDVVDAGDKTFVPEVQYDLILNHRVSGNGLAAGIGPQTRRVYLTTGSNHRFRNREFRRRLQALETRRGPLKDPQVWDEEVMPWVEEADVLVGFGNATVMSTWTAEFQKPAYAFENTAYFGDRTYKREWNGARNHFLFLGSWQQVAKGLDLLLEVFSGRSDLHLHVCSKFKHEADFCRMYERELFHRDNIHAHGWMDLFSKEFQAVACACGFVIHPSCSEGSPGSITNAMSMGLIPILSRNAGIDLNGAGLQLPECSIEEIDKMVEKVSKMSVEELGRLSESAWAEARSRFTEQAFRDRWRSILREIYPELHDEQPSR